MNLNRLIILLVLLTLSSSVQAQRFNKKIHDNHRDRTWEATLLLQSQTSLSEEFEGGSTLDIDSSTGFGFAFGWNWTEKVNLSWRFSLNKPGYTASIVPNDPEDPEKVPQVVSYKMSNYSNQFNFTYNFLKGRFTPFVQAGVGWTKLDSNIPQGPPDINCWWDPWWGYICFDDWKTYKTSQFTYSLGLGLRWDINGALFMRGSYNREFISLDSGSTNLDTLTLEGGLMW
jgi:opacity protein-like surface antigen